VRVDAGQKPDVERIFKLKSDVEGYQPSEFNFIFPS
jgi:hypothetical protein